MRELLLLPQSKINILKVVSFIGNDSEEYRKLIRYIIENKEATAKKASWAMSHCWDNNIGDFCSYLSVLLPVLNNKKYPDSIQRNIIRILQFTDIPEEFHVKTIDSCFELLHDKNKAAAILAFSMQVLFNFTLIYPELKNEVIISIENILPKATPGVKNRGKNILKKLK